MDRAAFRLCRRLCFYLKPETRGVAGEGDTRYRGLGASQDRWIASAENRKEHKKYRILHIEKGERSQINWCAENEGYIWRYFIDKEMLYSVDAKLIPRFLSPEPFSKFYLEIDNDSPGQVGAWIGWQIVRSYMKNNDVTINELMNKKAKEIFEQSKYKPKK